MATISNRSRFRVTVRNRNDLEQSRSDLNRQFSFPRKKGAEAYCAGLRAQGLKTSLAQLGMAFQLRIRRKGVKQRFLTFDSYEAAKQAMLRVEADLSVSIVRDYAVATRHTLADLMLRYIAEVTPGHKGGDIEAGTVLLL